MGASQVSILDSNTAGMRCNHYPAVRLQFRETPEPDRLDSDPVFLTYCYRVSVWSITPSRPHRSSI